MILGLGVDLCHVERIRRSLNGLGEAWIDELFTVQERKLCRKGADHAQLFARAFCGKEACFKALGTGNTDEIGWRDIEILQCDGAATAQLSGGALRRLQEITPPNYLSVVNIAFAGGARLAQAVITISAEPLP